jgi:hypothetical protein
MMEATNKWFGKSPFGPVCNGTEQVETPVGQSCIYCQEAIAEDDEGIVMPYHETEVSWKPTHRECLLRQVVGSVGHQQKRCSCHGGTEEDPPGLTKREAAKAAVALFERS